MYASQAQKLVLAIIRRDKILINQFRRPNRTAMMILMSPTGKNKHLWFKSIEPHITLSKFYYCNYQGKFYGEKNLLLFVYNRKGYEISCTPSINIPASIKDGKVKFILYTKKIFLYNNIFCLQKSVYLLDLFKNIEIAILFHIQEMLEIYSKSLGEVRFGSLERKGLRGQCLLIFKQLLL